jgi:hypothetical protein
MWALPLASQANPGDNHLIATLVMIAVFTAGCLYIWYADRVNDNV